MEVYRRQFLKISARAAGRVVADRNGRMGSRHGCPEEKRPA